MADQKVYWFQNSKTVIRLGKPLAWQGWAAYSAYIFLVLFPLVLKPVLGSNFFIFQPLNQVMWTIVLIMIAIKKGRPAEKTDESTEETEEYWFPKKEMGIGYGFPVTWQGWALNITFVLGLLSPLIIKPYIGKYYILVFILNSLCWGVFLLVMTIKHGEK